MPSLGPCPCNERSSFCFLYIIILSGLSILKHLNFSQCFAVIFIPVCSLLKSRVIWTKCYLLLLSPVSVDWFKYSQPIMSCLPHRQSKRNKPGGWGRRGWVAGVHIWLEREKTGIKLLPVVETGTGTRMASACEFQFQMSIGVHLFLSSLKSWRRPGAHNLRGAILGFGKQVSTEKPFSNARLIGNWQPRQSACFEAPELW